MGSENKSAFDSLEEFHMPRGLLPETVTGYKLEEDGSFVCTLSKQTYVTFGTGPEAKDVCYAKQLKGKIQDLKLSQLTGVTAKKLFIWVRVDTISRESADAGKIKFSVGPVSVYLPIEWFEKKEMLT